MARKASSTRKSGAHPGSSVKFSLLTELATFEEHLPELLASSPGKYVVIKSTKILGITDDYQSALKVGYSECGIEKPFFVEQVEAPELSHRRSRVLLTKLECLNLSSRRRPAAVGGSGVL